MQDEKIMNQAVVFDTAGKIFLFNSRLKRRIDNKRVKNYYHPNFNLSLTNSL